MKISEIFLTVQGEGRLEGVPSVLVRLVGCNLKCVWCDSKKEVILSEITPQELEKILLKYGTRHIVITGGEPMLCPEIEIFTKNLKEKGYHITIETNATIKRNVYADLVSMSPKLEHSGNNLEKTIKLEVIQYYINHYDYQLKFVVKNEYDFISIKKILDSLEQVHDEKVLMMPLSNSRKELEERQKEIVRLCIKYQYRYANRLQLQLWDNGNET